MRTFRRLLGFLRPYRLAVAASVVLACGALAAGVAIPTLIGRAVDDIRTGGGRLTTYGLAIAGLACARLALSVSRRLLAGRVSLRVELDLRDRLYEHLQRLEVGFFDRAQVGQLVSRATVDLQAIRFFLGYGLVFAVQSVVTLLAALAVMLWASPLLTAAVLWPAPLLVLVAARYGRRNRPASQEVQQRMAELAAEAEQSLSGVRVVKVYAAEAVRSRRFRSAAERVYDQAMLSTRLRAFYSPLIAFLPQLGLATLLLVGSRAVPSGAVTLGEFVAFYGYSVVLAGPLRMLGMVLGMAQRAVAAGNRVFELLDRGPQLPEPTSPVPVRKVRGALEFQRVWFGYERGRPLLRGLDLRVEAGATIALVGPTGAGKSTIGMLAARLYDPERGAVLLDGVDVRRLSTRELRRTVVLVGEDGHLFSDSLRANVAYARPDASDEQVLAALAWAGADELVEQLPEGLDTRLGERGYRLSGGQRQRVALARALLAAPRVLVLDDALSHVDPATERRIARRLRETSGDRTTLIVSHRPTLLELADEIVLISDGRVSARGAFPELLARSPRLAELVSTSGASVARTAVS